MKVVPDDNASLKRNRGEFAVLCGLSALLAAGLVLYAETQAFAEDEGFHLLAAQFIKNGRRPYIDFLFPQTPLNAYWNALWMWLFGESWHVPHAVAALMTAASVLLIADFVLIRFPATKWRLPAAIVTALLVALNLQVVSFGTIAQAYGLCLFLIVAAFRVAVWSVDRKSALSAAAAGLLGAGAAGCSLLTAPVAPFLLIWMLFSNRAGSRWRKAAAFVLGAVVASIPVIRLLALGPRQTIFNILEYNLLHRQESWAGATAHNLDVYTMWASSSQALILGLLAFAGIRFIATRSLWNRRLRSEFYLCGWLALALVIHISTARPTFQRYYLFLLPFLSILAATGLCAIASRLDRPDRPWRAVAVVSMILAVGLGNSLYESRNDFAWSDYEEVAGIVKKVTPPGGNVLADEQVYFLLKIPPPPGMELSDSHKLSNLPPSLVHLLHVVPQAELERRIKAEEFSTVQVCGTNDPLLKLNPPQYYSQTTETEACTVFSSPVRPAAASAP